MNSHYIPRLLLRKFAEGEKINTYDFGKEAFQMKKIRNTFSMKDLFDKELEQQFASKLEGPVGDMLNHKLLVKDSVVLSRSENKLLRKFLMVNDLRTPISNGSWEEMLERTRMGKHPSVKLREYMIRTFQGMKEVMEQISVSKETYLPNLKLAMKFDDLADLADPKNKEIPLKLTLSARFAMVTAIAFWDSEESGEEFILPKLPGVSQMDQVGEIHKGLIIQGLIEQKKKEKVPKDIKRELDRLLYGSMVYSNNFSIYPLSPTRVLICFSPFFRAFFPIKDAIGKQELYPPLLPKKDFNSHFFEPMRMELFEPCESFLNCQYQYKVHRLSKEEVQQLNSLLLNLETEEFAFHDYNKIRDSFWYYDRIAKFALPKNHNFSRMI